MKGVTFSSFSPSPPPKNREYFELINSSHMINMSRFFLVTFLWDIKIDLNTDRWISWKSISPFFFSVFPLSYSFKFFFCFTIVNPTFWVIDRLFFSSLKQKKFIILIFQWLGLYSTGLIATDDLNYRDFSLILILWKK